MNKLYTFLLIFSFCALQAVAQQVSLTTLNAPYEQDFNTLASSSSSSVLPQGWLMAESGSSGANNGLYIAGTGSGNAGDTYSFGAAGSTERAFGTLRSGTLIPVIGAAFTNNTGATITSLQIQYHGEQWRLGTANRGSDRLDFQISFDASSLLTGTWTNIDDLDFTGPVNTGSTGALNGNTNSTTISFEITGLNVSNGQIFFIRWTDTDVSGADDGLGIDNFTLTPEGDSTTDPLIAFTPSSLSFGDVNVGQQQTLSYEVLSFNLTAPINITADDAAFTLSTDNINFSSSVSLPETGGLIHVRFSPSANGLIETSLLHTSDVYSNSLSVSGFGFEQASNIVPIADARSMSVGTKVTVAGRITVANEHGNPAYLQDDTGGIPVFDFSLASGVQIGDSLIVTGPIGIFNDQKQISGSGIFFTKVETTPRFIDPKIITLPELAANEGLLVTVQDVELVNKNFVFYPQSTEQMTDGTSQEDVRIDGDTNIPGLSKPQGVVDITGVVGRFRTSAQLLPRFQQDIPGAEEPVADTDSIPANKTLDVVTWNLEFFGAEREDYNEEFGPADELLQLQNIKRVLDSLNADIIAVEEVSDEEFLASLVEQMGKYRFTCSGRYSYSFQGPDSTFPPQKVCFIYDSTTIQLLSARPMFESQYDSARSVDPSLLPDYPTGDPSNFYSSGRLPYLLKVKATVEGVSENISLIAIHAKSGASAEDHSRRAYDAAVLKDSLDLHFGGEQIIILGDLNDDLDQSIAAGLATPYQDFVIDTAYSPITKPLSDAGARSTTGFGDVIDHQIITSELNEEYLEGSAQIIAPFRYITNYANTTSDHLPVISRYLLQAPVVSFVESSITVSEDTAMVRVMLTLNKPLTENKTLEISISGSAEYGADYTSVPVAETGVISLAVTAGQSIIDFEINIINDLLDELMESAVFTIQPGEGIETGSSVFTMSIDDNDIPSVSFDRRYTEIQEGDNRPLKLKLSGPVASDEYIEINVYEGPKVNYSTDYTTNPSVVEHQISLAVPAGSSEVAIDFNALSDRKREFFEVVSFYLAETTTGLTRSGNLLSVVHIEDKKHRPHFVVFPNPTKDIIQLQCEGIDEDQIIHAELRNGYGERVFRGAGTIDDLNAKLGKMIEHCRKGVYTLEIRVGDEISILRILKI